MPTSGPVSWDVWAGQHDPKNLPYAFVRVTPKVANVLSKANPRLVTEFQDRSRPQDIRFGIGDILSVTIFEATSGGLFIPAEGSVRPGNFITIPAQAVDIYGNVSIPYAGTIRARGRTQVEVQQAIVDALKDRAIEPQVVVSTVEQRTSLITVVGDVGRPSRIPAQLAPERILDAITRAGGPAGPGPDEWILLERNGRRALAPFGALVYEPANNIWVHPNDTIYLYRERLSDAIADPASVFLYRGETREVAQALGIDCSPFDGPIIPVIYNLNLRNPGSYFLASTFEMRNKDVIQVTNSVSSEATKFLTYLRTINSTLNDPISSAINGYTLKNLLKGVPTTTAVITGSTPIVTAPVSP